MGEEKNKIEDELRKIVDIKKPVEEKVKIHYDEKRQIYTMRIPVNIAREADINVEKNKFKFIITYEKEGKKFIRKLKGEFFY